MKKLLLLASLFFVFETGYSQCANPANAYTFTYNGTVYQIVKENKTWIQAAACAASLGGYLAEINTPAENAAIFAAATSAAAGVNNASTSAPDGGGASYIWIGANDLATEGTWIWDGNNDAIGPTFYMGTGAAGAPVGGLYNNWGSSGFGSEPDNFGAGQDGGAMALTNWPLGLASQWNDISENNSIYYIIEDPQNVLPIQIESFGAILQNDESIKVSWRATTESSHDEFILERKASLGKYKEIFRSSNHTPNIQSDFEFVDYEKIQGDIWYRLVHLNIDQDLIFSPEISINVGAVSNKNLFSIFPNPSDGIFHFNYIGNEHLKSKAVIEVFNLQGLMIFKDEINSTQSMAAWNAQEMPRGIYFYHIHFAHINEWQQSGLIQLRE